VPLAILTPKNGETVRGIVRVVAEAALPVKFSVDGQRKGTDKTATSTFLWHTTKYENGDHRLEAKIELGDGKTETASVDVVVENAKVPAQVKDAPPKPVNVTVRPPTIWDEDGVFVDAAENYSPQVHGEWAWAAGFRWVAPRIQDGVTPANVGHLRGSGTLGLLRTRGFRIAGWHVCRENPEAEIPVLVQQVAELGLDGIIANAEYEYEYSAGSSEPDRAERYGRSRRFLTAFRAALPNTPLALSTFGRADRHDLDWPAWIQDGAHFMPQAYPNVAAELEVGLCVDGAGRCLSSAVSWTPDRVHPTLNNTAEGSGLVPPAKYAADLAAASVKGFSVYLGEVMTEADYAALAPAASR
jgi:hypothetical protein